MTVTTQIKSACRSYIARKGFMYAVYSYDVGIVGGAYRKNEADEVAREARLRFRRVVIINRKGEVRE